MLLAWNQGNAAAGDQLMAFVYGELRRLAAQQLRGRREDSLHTIELVHEAYLRLVKILGSKR